MNNIMGVFDKKFGVGVVIGIGITRQHHFLMEYTSLKTLKRHFGDLNPDKHLEVQKETKERYLSYISLRKI